MQSSKKPSAPSYLQPATRVRWEAVIARWQLEDHHIRLLTLASEAWDRGQQAREQILRDGPTTGTKEGGLRSHPAVRIENDCRLAFARLIRELDLDLEAPPRPVARRHCGACDELKLRTAKVQVSELPTPAWTYALLLGEIAPYRIAGWVTQGQAGHFGEPTVARPSSASCPGGQGRV